MRKKVDLSHFECGLVVGARPAGLNILETANLGFSHTTISIVYRDWCEKEQISSSGSSLGKNTFLMPEV